MLATATMGRTGGAYAPREAGRSQPFSYWDTGLVACSVPEYTIGGGYVRSSPCAAVVLRAGASRETTMTRDFAATVLRE